MIFYPPSIVTFNIPGFSPMELIGLFSITPFKVIALNFLYLIFSISLLLDFLIALLNVIALPTIAIEEQ